MKKIEGKIVGWEVIKEDEPAKVKMELLTEETQRPEELEGRTYKIKTPMSDHAVYVTINDIILNKGSDEEMRRPFEIFINCKDVQHFQWVSALTRMISAVFRKGGNVEFIIDELVEVFDPKGGYFKRGRFMNSLVAEIGYVIKEHMISTGSMKAPELAPEVKEYIEKKKQEAAADPLPANRRASDAKTGPQLCSKCNEAAVIKMDGCLTCTSCGDSKCS